MTMLSSSQTELEARILIGLRGDFYGFVPRISFLWFLLVGMWSVGWVALLGLCSCYVCVQLILFLVYHRGTFVIKFFAWSYGAFWDLWLSSFLG